MFKTAKSVQAGAKVSGATRSRAGHRTPPLVRRLIDVEGSGYHLTGWTPALEGKAGGFTATLCGPFDLRAKVGRDGWDGRRWDQWPAMEQLAQAAEDAQELWWWMGPDEALALMIATLVEAEEVRRA